MEVAVVVDTGAGRQIRGRPITLSVQSMSIEYIFAGE
jgi:hypothetical protein